MRAASQANQARRRAQHDRLRAAQAAAKKQQTGRGAAGAFEPQAPTVVPPPPASLPSPPAMGAQRTAAAESGAAVGSAKRGTNAGHTEKNAATKPRVTHYQLSDWEALMDKLPANPSVVDIHNVK